MGVLIRHEGCLSCGSSDAKAVYQDEDGSENSHCFSCSKTVASKEYIEEKNQEKTRGKRSAKTKDTMSEDTEVKTKSKPVITPEVAQEIKDRTSYKLNNWRGISDETSKFFGIRAEYNESSGEIDSVYYPITNDEGLSGYKKRLLPKSFSSIGLTGKDSQLFGQFRYKNKQAKYCLIVEGETDVCSAYQMLKEYQDTRGGDFEPPVVVGVTVGAQSAHKQIAANYAFFEQFTKVLYMPDMDEPGLAAVDNVAKALPRGKAFIMKGDLKDATEYLEKGKDKAFINYFYKAQAYVPAGVLASTDIYQKMLNQSTEEKIALPPIFKKLNDMLGGGLALRHAYTCSGVTGGGKTSVVNEMVYHWIFNSPYTVGVVSLELNAAQYGEVLLSRHIKQKLAKMNAEEKTKFLNSDATKLAAKELFEHEDGTPRFMLVDDRESSFEQFQAVVEQMIISAGVSLIVVDPWTDIGIDGLSIDEQAVAMKWIKAMIKTHNCTFFLINHVRKGQSGQKDQSSGGMITESDIMGSSSVMKSASANILLVRNKLAEDELERNSTKIFLSKNRLLSETGPAGTLYYDSDTHMLHDLETWKEENGIDTF